MKGQDITIAIAAKSYKMTAVTPKMESYIRLAAKEINKSLDEMNLSYSEAHIDEKFSIISVRQTVAKYLAQEEIKELKAQIAELNTVLASYMQGLE